MTKTDVPDPVCARSWPWALYSPGPYPEAVCLGGLVYTFDIGNSGTKDAVFGANDVVVRDPLMPGTVFDSVLDSAGFTTCGVDANNVFTCKGGTVPAGQIKTVKIQLTAPSATGMITNIVTVDPNNVIFEADETNNTGTATTIVKTGVDLAVFKSGAPDPVATSGTEVYTILVKNFGTQDAAGVRVRDTLPAGTIFRDVIADPGPVNHGFTCGFSNGIVECLGGTLKGSASNNYPKVGGVLANPPDTATIVIRIFAQSYAGTMHNEVRVDPLNEIPEANEDNNIASVDTEVKSLPTGGGGFNQLTIAKVQTSPNKNNTARNALVTWSITVGNTGTDPAVGVAVADYLPAGSRYYQATGTNMFNCSQAVNYISCVGGAINGGASATITLQAFAPDTPGSYVNQAIVDPNNAIPEGDELDNQAFETTVVANGGEGAFNDLKINKTGTIQTTPGGPISYTLTVSNDGTNAALNVAVRDVLPTGEVFVSAADTAPLMPGAFTCGESAGTIDCIGATINAGGSRTIFIQATAPQKNISLTNEAVVDPENTIPEGDELNNTDTADTLVSSAIDLTIKKTGPTTANQSQESDYKITVTNNKVGATGQDAFGVHMHDPLPVGLIVEAIDSGSGNNWACQVQGDPINVVDCLGDLPLSKPEVTIDIKVFMTAISGRSLDNIACVDPGDTIVESDETNNCSSSRRRWRRKRRTSS